MKAFWVRCDKWFTGQFPGQCSGVVRQNLEPERTKCDTCDWLNSGVLALHYPAGAPCGSEGCKGIFLDVTPHQHLVYNNEKNDLTFAVQLGPSEHTRNICDGDHERPGCFVCELFACSRCGGFEGSLPTECPGERMADDRPDEVYKGLIDFVGGRWVHGACSRSSPAWPQSEAGKKELEQYRVNKHVCTDARADCPHDRGDALHCRIVTCANYRGRCLTHARVGDLSAPSDGPTRPAM